MATGLAFGSYLLPPPVLLHAKHFAEDRGEITHRFLAAAFAETASYRAALSQQQGLFEDFYRKIEAGSETPVEEIEAVADAVHEAAERSYSELAVDLKEITASVGLYRRRRDRNAQSMARLGEEIIDICAAWYEVYQNLEIRLRKLASDRDPTAPSRVFSDSTEAVRYLRSAAG